MGVLAVLALLMPLRVRLALRSDSPTARLQVLGERLEAHDGPGAAPGAPFDGEWWLVIHSFSIAAATNLAFRQPEDAPARRVQIARWLDLMLTPEVRAFDTAQWNEDALQALDGSNGHVGVLGHVAWALGASCLVGNAPHPLVGPIADALHRRFSTSRSALIETYPGERYVPDTLVAVAGLSLLRRCQRAPADPEVDRFLSRLEREHLDAETGLFVFAPGQPARGSGAAWTAWFLCFIDDARARVQFERVFRVFGQRLPFGALAVREWPVGVSRGGDVDSGPLLFGLSPSATGFAMAGPALTNDAERLHSLRLTAETAGVTVGARYLLSPLVGDAIVLATSTATTWTDGLLPAPRPAG